LYRARVSLMHSRAESSQSSMRSTVSG
jgi:hypothetical protein